jgi:sulfatase modifying factor 1
MVLIPEGPFQMGSLASGGDLDEMPQHAVFLPAFYMDLKEVTQAQFAQFSQATQYPKPVVPVFQEELSLITKPELPVVGVPWDAAKDYCQWAGKRLPTEAEWEKAAGGEEGYRWPWGNDFLERASNLQGEEDGYKYFAPPGQFESGRSPYGLYDMAGNAAEWVMDWYDADYYKTAPFKVPKGPETGKFRVYRGGSWNDASGNARVAKRFAAAPHQTSAVIGFRCAKDVSPGEATKFN